MHLLIDYGGTKFRYSFVEDLHAPMQITTLESKDIDLKEFLDAHLHSAIHSLRISFAGQVAQGIILASPNTSEKNFDIKQYLNERKLQTKLYLQNDLNCAALAVMHRFGYEDFLLLFLGTGFGAAFVHRRRVLKGDNHLSLEMGHIPFVQTPFVCGCGNDNCLELSVSGSAIQRWCNHFATKLKYHSYDELKNLNDAQFTSVIENFEQGLEYAVKTSLTLFDSNRLILGGGMFESSKLLLERVKLYANTTPFANLKKIEVIEVNLKESSLEGTRYL